MEPGTGLTTGVRQRVQLLTRSGPVRWGRARLALAAAAGVLMLVEKRRVNIPEGFML